MNCPNLFPTIPSTLRLAVIGETPSKDDIYSGQPFSGPSGRFLAALLSRAGISRESCYLGNLRCSDDISADLYQIKQDLAVFKPNLIVCLDSAVLNAARQPQEIFLSQSFKQYAYKISQWRGSLFMAHEGSALAGYKCLATYSPAYCLRDYESTPFLQFDLRKAVREAASPLLRLPIRKLDVGLSIGAQIAHLISLRTARKMVALDIEGGIDTMSCISFAISELEAFIIPINQATTPEVWRALAAVLEDENVPKVLQNSLYDRFVLHYSYGIRVRGVVDDTMLKHWELYSELEKSLGVQASLYTDEPYYKFERKTDDDETFFRYCCKDSAVTLEINQHLERMVLNESRKHYDFNVALLNPLLYMEMRGIKYGSAEAATRRALLRQKLFECQAKFNALTGFGFPFKSTKEIFTRRSALMMRRDGSGYLKPYIFTAMRVDELLKEPRPNLATIGELEDLCEVSLNVSSNKQLISFLYETLKLPTQYKIVRGAPEGTTPPTADYEALLKLSRWCIQNDKPHLLAIVQAIIEIRSLDTRQQMLSISADRDGRIRCGYNLVGTNTGRISCYESPTGSGYNLQTIPNYQDTKDAPGGVLGDRDLFMADDGYWLFQCDLTGADGWTVAAYCAMLGDRAMFDDYLAGIKPYARIALKVEGRPEADWKDRRELAAFLSTYKLRPIPKLTAKKVQHGGAYLEGGLTISRNILKDSEGKVYWSPTECDKLKNWYTREKYWGIPKWHDFIGRRIRERPVLTAASGQVRQFFGRPDDILTKAVAFEPQANTTYAINFAAWRLWSDNENRSNKSFYSGDMDRRLQTHRLLEAMPDGRPPLYLKVQPLHQVHDALIGQFRKEDTTWAVAKIKEWFNNQLTIANQQITISFDGEYGPSWGNLNEGKI
jgi:uracil-DNA glycosylase family 4